VTPIDPSPEKVPTESEFSEGLTMPLARFCSSPNVVLIATIATLADLVWFAIRFIRCHVAAPCSVPAVIEEMPFLAL